MSLKQSLFALVAAVFALLLMFMMGQNAKKSYIQEQASLESFSKEAKSLAGLKAKFSNKENVQRAIQTLNRIARPAKDFKKSDVQVLVYENLKESTLGVMLRKIENGTLDIKKLDVIRVNGESATLRLEIKK